MTNKTDTEEALIEQIKNLRGDIASLVQTASRRTKQLWVGTAVAIAVSLFAIIGAIVVSIRFNEFLDQRDARSVGSCKQENARVNQGMRHIGSFLGQSNSPQIQPLIDEINTTFADRDCSIEGIKKYLNNLNP